MANSKVDEIHIRHCMLFLFRQQKNATDATREISLTYGNVLKVNKCQRWFQKFQSGNFDLLDDHRSGRPPKLDNEILESLVVSNPCQTIQELSTNLNSSWSSTQEHLKQIGKVYRCGKWIPHDLSKDNKMKRLTISYTLLTRQKNEPFLHRVVTGDEKWVFYQNNKRKNQWLSPRERPIPTPKNGLHPKKTLLCVWWDYIGIIHFELMQPGQTITADVYCEQLDRLHEKLRLKRPALVNRKGVILQQDNARPHSAKRTQEKIRQLGWEVLSHHPYSPDMAPSDYHLFRSMEHNLRNRTFGNVEDVNSSLTNFFASKDCNFFKTGIYNLEERWATIADNNGEYFIN